MITKLKYYTNFLNNHNRTNFAQNQISLLISCFFFIPDKLKGRILYGFSRSLNFHQYRFKIITLPFTHRPLSIPEKVDSRYKHKIFIRSTPTLVIVISSKIHNKTQNSQICFSFEYRFCWYICNIYNFVNTVRLEWCVCVCMYICVYVFATCLWQ